MKHERRSGRQIAVQWQGERGEGAGAEFEIFITSAEAAQSPVEGASESDLTGNLASRVRKA